MFRKGAPVNLMTRTSNIKLIRFFSLISLFFASVACLPLHAQSLRFVSKIATGVVSVAKAGDGSILLNKSLAVEKYNLDSGFVTHSFSALSQGEVTWIDAKNRFKIFLFSAPYQQICYLDNRLTVLSEQKSLSALTQSQIQCICASFNDGFWMYEPMCSCLKRINKEGKIAVTTDFLPMFVFDTLFRPVQLLECKNNLLALDSNYGLLFFDLFGNFIRPFPVKGCQYITESGKMVFLLVRDTVWAFSEHDWKLMFKLRLPQTNLKAILADEKYVILLNRKGELFHYRWENMGDR